ncbi:MAG: acetylxylan esterase, partial [Planctomycetia bacterium]
AGISNSDPNAWGTIAAWSWGTSRVIDVLAADPLLDSKKIIVVGHSRLGKAALLTAAFDERVALAIPNQAGCGGTAPSRGTVGESVQRINTSFPHWFNANFKEFNAQPARIPFDQNCLVAICAPRPVLFTNAVEDTWANPDGQFEVLKAAQG